MDWEEKDITHPCLQGTLEYGSLLWVLIEPVSRLIFYKIGYFKSGSKGYS